MNILDWISVGSVSAERDSLLSNYFYDNGVLRSVISDPSSFLVLGRKGAGKTAVFRYLRDNKEEFISDADILSTMSFEDYNWNVHALLSDGGKADSTAYKQSWKFLILVDCIREYVAYFNSSGIQAPQKIGEANRVLEKVFDAPVPPISKLVGRKLLSLSKLSLPKVALGLGEEGLSADAGEISFDEVKQSSSLRSHLSENIKNLISLLEEAILDSMENLPTVFIAFDRVDEAWDDVSYESSKRVISGLVIAGDSIVSKYGGRVRPIVFLREDIFDVLSINDPNKLREDCGELLNWNKPKLASLMLHRINYFAKENGVEPIFDIDALFDKKEMRQRAKPFNHLLKRTMMRPRDLISILRRTIKAMNEKVNDPFSDDAVMFEKIETDSIYSAEPGYSEWLKKELLDEWGVQKPVISTLFNAIQNGGSTNITKESLIESLEGLGASAGHSEVNDHLRFLFDNSIIGLKVGESKEWRYKCFYPSQGFLDSDEYRVHEGLVRSLNLKEPRERGGSE